MEKLSSLDMRSQIEIRKTFPGGYVVTDEDWKNFSAPDMWSQTVPIFFSYIGRGYAVQLLQRLVKW